MSWRRTRYCHRLVCHLRKTTGVYGWNRDSFLRESSRNFSIFLVCQGKPRNEGKLIQFLGRPPILSSLIHSTRWKVVAHASPPITATPGFRQYDLFIDGQSFFTMPKAYELGIRGQIPSHARVPGSYGGYDNAQARAPMTTAQEDADLQRAISASLTESRRFLASKQRDEQHALTALQPSPPATADLMDLGGTNGQPQTRVADSQSIAPVRTDTGYFGQPQYASQPPMGAYRVEHVGAAQVQSHVSQNPMQSNALVASTARPVTYAPSNFALAPAAAPSFTHSQSTPPLAHSGVPALAHRGVPAQPSRLESSAPTSDLLVSDTFGTPAGDPYGRQPYLTEVDPFAPRPPPQPTRDDITNSVRLWFIVRKFRREL